MAAAAVVVIVVVVDSRWKRLLLSRVSPTYLGARAEKSDVSRRRTDLPGAQERVSPPFTWIGTRARES